MEKAMSLVQPIEVEQANNGVYENESVNIDMLSSYKQPEVLTLDKELGDKVEVFLQENDQYGLASYSYKGGWFHFVTYPSFKKSQIKL